MWPSARARDSARHSARARVRRRVERELARLLRRADRALGEHLAVAGLDRKRRIGGLDAAAESELDRLREGVDVVLGRRSRVDEEGMRQRRRSRTHQKRRDRRERRSSPSRSAPRKLVVLMVLVSSHQRQPAVVFASAHGLGLFGEQDGCGANKQATMAMSTAPRMYGTHCHSVSPTENLNFCVSFSPFSFVSVTSPM